MDEETITHRKQAAASPLAVSCLTLRPGAIGGVEQMLLDLLRGLVAIGAPLRLVATRAQASHLVARGVAASEAPLLVRRFGSRFLAEEACPWWPLAARHTLLFPNDYTPFFRPRRASAIMTVVHDVLYRDHPRLVPAARRVWRGRTIARTLRTADAVICISAFTRDRLRHHFGERHAAKLHVVPNPVNVDKFAVDPAVPRRHPRRYVLSVAHHFEHKNLLTLVEGFRRLAARRDDVDLVLVGQLSNALDDVSYSERLRRAIGDSDRIRMTGFVTDDDLGVFYRDAELFAMPSLYEGFGRPVVEALALGVPVVASDLAVFREIAQNGVTFVAEPRSAAAWAAALDGALAAGVTVPAAARTRVRARFAPARIAQAYLEVAEALG
jgi:glycosyltransferase involved in cell wall biosynthesis